MAIMLMPAFAYAGKVQPQPVEIDLDAMSASGDMYSARNSKNDEEFIGCGTRHFEIAPDQVFVQGFCQAGLEEEESVTCFTQNTALLDAMDSIGDNSYVVFSWTEDEDGARTCNYIGTSTQSFYLGKGKLNKPGKSAICRKMPVQYRI